MLRNIRNFSNQRKNQTGFTLVELILIIVIIGIAVVPLTHLITTNTKAVADIALFVQAEFFTQSIMEEIIADYRSSDRGYDWVVNNWNGVSRSHPDLSMTAHVSLSSDTDANTGIHFTTVSVTVKPASSLTRVRLTCQLVDDDT